MGIVRRYFDEYCGKLAESRIVVRDIAVTGPSVAAPARTGDEPRFLSIGKIDGKHWAAVWTPRGNAVRIISVRRARTEEIGHYEGN